MVIDNFVMIACYPCGNTFRKVSIYNNILLVYTSYWSNLLQRIDVRLFIFESFDSIIGVPCDSMSITLRSDYYDLSERSELSSIIDQIR